MSTFYFVNIVVSSKTYYC